MNFAALAKKYLPTLVWLDLTGMILGGVWLLAADALKYAWPGALGVMVSPLFLPFVLFPAALFAGLMSLFERGGKPWVGKLMAVLSVLYLLSAMSGWVTFIFYTLSGAPEVPAVIFSVAAGVAPWSAHALKDRDNAFFTGLIFMMHIAATVLVFANGKYRLGHDYGLKFLIVWGTMILLTGGEALYEKFVTAKKLAKLSKTAVPPDKT